MIPEEVLRIVMDFRPIDDDFMVHIFTDNTPLVEYVLRIILNKDDLVVVSSETQYTVGALGYRNLRFDVFAKDSEGKLYDIEIQRDNAGAIPRRARYHSSAIDATYLNKGESFDKLPESYVIFFTERDVIKGGLPLYSIERTVVETGKPVKPHTTNVACFP